jgi:HK97 family phage major capsid protein
MTTVTENERLLETLTTKRMQRAAGNRPVSQRQMREVVRQIVARAERAKALELAGEAGANFSISRFARGCFAMRGQTITAETADEDIAFVRALSPTSVPGSYAIPPGTWSEYFLTQLGSYATLRKAGCTVLPCPASLQLNLTQASTSPTCQWMPFNSVQTPSDFTGTQISFPLKPRQSLSVVATQLLKTSVPALDVFLLSVCAQGLAALEDAAIFAASDVSNAPHSLYANAGITTVMVGSSANGGNIGVTDLFAVLKAYRTAKGKTDSPRVWIMSGDCWNRILSLLDTTSRPLIASDIVEGPLGAEEQYYLFGHRVLLTDAIPSNLTNGSGSGQTAAFFMAVNTLLIAQSSEIALAIGQGQLFDAAASQIRVGDAVDFEASPISSVVALKGVNA